MGGGGGRGRIQVSLIKSGAMIHFSGRLMGTWRDACAAGRLCGK